MRAGPTLLGTCEAERRPIAQRNVAWSLGNWRSLRQKLPPAVDWPTRELIYLGAAYASAAVVPDGTPSARPGPHYLPGARPGVRAPHAWIATSAGRRSTIDLSDREFVLLAGPAGGAWADAALPAAQAHAVPLLAITLAEPHWASLYEVDLSGAVLVRPDGHVAWRTRTTPADPAREITDALTTITSH